MNLLDHGYLNLVEVWGSDEAIVRAARMSTDKGFLGWGPHHEATCEITRRSPAALGHFGSNPAGVVCTCSPAAGDEKLLKYLYDNKHATPFEFAGLVVEVQAPIFVFREWHRHRTQAYNEMSARYTPLPDLNYVPTVERLLMGGGHLTRQAGSVAGAVALTEVAAANYRDRLVRAYEDDQALYEEALGLGVPKELARIHLPVGRYSRMRAITSLRNWMAFMTLRSAPTAQFEIRCYSQAIGKLIAGHFPRVWDVFMGAALCTSAPSPSATS